LALIQGVRGGDWPAALLRALAFALAVLPNEIPVVLALFLALGALRLMKIGVLARRSAAVESLGSATLLAVDKTGTLTENRMALQRLLVWPEGAQVWRGQPLENPGTIYWRKRSWPAVATRWMPWSLRSSGWRRRP
jgi:Ca2+-transporting ATPase